MMGPTMAIQNSVFGSEASFSIWATPPKQEQSDLVNWDPVGLGNDRVRQLVREQAGKEKHARDDGCAPHDRITPIAVHGMKLRDQRKSDQQRYD